MTSARRRTRLLTLVTIAFVLAVPTLAWAAPADFQSLRDKGWLWAYLGVFTAGFLTSLTPCVYPMIPIVVGVFGARGESVTRRRAFALASLYVLGMGTMYSALGVGVALTGKAFGTLLANPFVIVPLVIFYAVLASSMFGAFEMSLPPALQERLSTVGGKGFGGAFAMGLVGGLTAAPCTGPILAGLLAFVATTHDVLLGFTLLFTYALGMGILFWLIATFAVALPKSGRWMESVKSITGIGLLVMGAYFLRPVFPALARITSTQLGFLLGALALVAAGLALGSVHLSFHDVTRVKVRKLAGIALTVAGMVGAVNYLLTPKHPVPWLHDEASALASARASGKKVLIDFGAEWCGPCKKYDVSVFSDPTVNAYIRDHFVALKVDATRADAVVEAVQTRYHAPSLPTVIMLNPDGSECQRVVGDDIPTPQAFLATLARCG